MNISILKLFKYTTDNKNESENIPILKALCFTELLQELNPLRTIITTCR